MTRESAEGEEKKDLAMHFLTRIAVPSAPMSGLDRVFGQVRAGACRHGHGARRQRARRVAGAHVRTPLRPAEASRAGRSQAAFTSCVPTAP